MSEKAPPLLLALYRGGGGDGRQERKTYIARLSPQFLVLDEGVENENGGQQRKWADYDEDVSVNLVKDQNFPKLIWLIGFSVVEQIRLRVIHELQGGGDQHDQ